MKFKRREGITLVALVITIIILLILAGISIQALTNQGLFAQADSAKKATEIANIKEQVNLDIYQKQLEPPLGSITQVQLESILSKYGTVVYGDDGTTIKSIKTESGHEILLADIYSGEIEKAFVGTTVEEAIEYGDALSTRNKELKDSKNNKIVIPAGFKVTQV